MKKVKQRLFDIIQAADDNDTASRIFDICIILLIILNVVLVIADTFEMPPVLTRISEIIEVVSVVIFTIEYILRVWTSDLLYPQLSPFKARLKYTFSFMALIDLIAILPFYIPFVFQIDLRVLRLLRVVRLFRVFKINRYTSALSTIGNVFKRKKSQLLSSVIVVFLLMIIASVLMYNAEHDAQPEVFTNAFSALWWAIVTITTVGYGDIYPVTALGKVLGTVIAILGIGLIAVPTGIISAGFMETIGSGKNDKENDENGACDCGDEIKYCPYCGKKLK